MCLHLVHVPGEPNQNFDARTQFRIGRSKLLTMEFADFEAHIRDDLDRMLSAGGFSSTRDIAAITVNRWSHGYSYTASSLFDGDHEAIMETARQPVGRVAIANADAQWEAYARHRPGGARGARGAGLMRSEASGRGTMLKSRIMTAAMAMVLVAPIPAVTADFPYDQEMLLDVKPLPGSKRVPILEIGVDGRAQVDLWCRSGLARVVVNGEAIAITLGPLREEGCTPERTARDDAMMTALSEVRQWRIEEDVVVLTGPTELRFRLSTH
jgi:hypothetical protein